MEKLVDFLKNEITNEMTLENIIQVFEKMCRIPIENDMILFETGTCSFTGEPLFYFSLVRQFPNEEDEYYQIHVDVLYKPNEQNKLFNEETWNEGLNEDIFDYIRKTEAFTYAKGEKYIEVEIYIDET